MKLAIAVLLAGFGCAFAQSLSGTVIDAMGAVIPAARVTLTLDGARLEATTDDSGTYAFEGLRAGQYWITAEHLGFSHFSGGVRIDEGEHVSFPAIMLEPMSACFPLNPMVPRYRVDTIPGTQAKIVGRVVPPYRADVELKTIAGVNVSTVHGSTDKRGEFRFSDVSSGRHRLYITPDLEFFGANPMDLVSHPGESLVIEPIRLKRPPPLKKGQPITVCE